MPYHELKDESEYANYLSQSSEHLLVVDFFATWCGPCNMIAPFFKDLSQRYNDAIFLKVDIDKHPGTGSANRISAMPTFVLFRNRAEVDRLTGADKTKLEAKVKQHYSAAPAPATGAGAEGEAAPAGTPTAPSEFADLNSMIDKSQCECLNQHDDHTWEHAFNTASALTWLQSDVDEQLLIAITFQQTVKLHSIVLQAPADGTAPKSVKLFINQTRTIDFDEAEKMTAVQILEPKPEDLKDNTAIPLNYVKFQNVHNITLFVPGNQSGGEVTKITHIKFIGKPVAVTNMNEFKRIAGQAGEAHG